MRKYLFDLSIFAYNPKSCFDGGGDRVREDVSSPNPTNGISANRDTKTIGGISPQTDNRGENETDSFELRRKALNLRIKSLIESRFVKSAASELLSSIPLPNTQRNSGEAQEVNRNGRSGALETHQVGNNEEQIQHLVDERLRAGTNEGRNISNGQEAGIEASAIGADVGNGFSAGSGLDREFKESESSIQTTLSDTQNISAGHLEQSELRDTETLLDNASLEEDSVSRQSTESIQEQEPTRGNEGNVNTIQPSEQGLFQFSAQSNGNGDTNTGIENETSATPTEFSGAESSEARDSRDEGSNASGFSQTQGDRNQLSGIDESAKKSESNTMPIGDQATSIIDVETKDTQLKIEKNAEIQTAEVLTDNQQPFLTFNRLDMLRSLENGVGCESPPLKEVGAS